MEVYLKRNDALKYINKHMTERIRFVSTVHLNSIKTDYEANSLIQLNVVIDRSLTTTEALPVRSSQRLTDVRGAPYFQPRRLPAASEAPLL